MTEAQTERVKDFLRDLEELMISYQITISYQSEFPDYYSGDFILEEFSPQSLQAIKDAEVRL